MATKESIEKECVQELGAMERRLDSKLEAMERRLILKLEAVERKLEENREENVHEIGGIVGRVE